MTWYFFFSELCEFCDWPTLKNGSHIRRHITRGAARVEGVLRQPSQLLPDHTGELVCFGLIDWMATTIKQIPAIDFHHARIERQFQAS